MGVALGLVENYGDKRMRGGGGGGQVNQEGNADIFAIVSWTGH